MTEAPPQTTEIVVEGTYPHPPEVLWRALTTPALMARWLMEPHGFEAVVGNRFTYRTTPAGAWDGTIACEVLEVIPGERLAYAWRSGNEANEGYGSPLDTVVTFTLERVAAGTRLRIVHSGFILPRNELAHRNMSGGWSGIVRRVGEIAAEQSQP